MQILSYIHWVPILLLVGCQLSPPYETPSMNIPENWHADSDELTTNEPDNFVWWEALNDPQLNELIKRAAEQNLDLFIAGTRILATREERKAKQAENYPHLDASVTTGHVYYSKDALINGILGTACASRNCHATKRNVNFFEVGFDADWEIDLFGANKHAILAADAKIEASNENFCDIWVTLSAEVARNYIEIRSLQQRLELIDQNIALQQDKIYLTEELVSIGVMSQLDSLAVSDRLRSLVAQRPLLQQGIDKGIHRLSTLLGYTPEVLFPELQEHKPLPQLPCEKPIGLPSELLRRRPDIRRAERELEASTEMVASSIAALFPRFSLFGFIGSISTQLHSLGSGASGTWLAAPQLLFPIFNSRLLTQDVNMNKIQTRQALFEYQKAVILALEETENGIASFQYELKRNQSLLESEGVQTERYRLSQELYRSGIQSYIEVLNVADSLLSSKDAIIQSDTDLLLHYISLYKALGGGWNICQTSKC